MPVTCRFLPAPCLGVSNLVRHKSSGCTRSQKSRWCYTRVSARQAQEAVQIICKLFCPDSCLPSDLSSLCLCRQEDKSATDQAPRHPPQPLQEAAESLSGKHSRDDGRVVRGRSKPAQDGSGGRFYLNVTGFPFPLGPLFARQTVRCEVHTLLRLEVVMLK